MKLCSRCHKELPDSAFNKRASTKCGLRPECRECQSTISKGYPGPARPKPQSKTRYLKMRIDGENQCVHRAIMEKALGRKLDTLEYVHHINGNKHDNRPENLMLVSPKEHKKYHPNHD